jgi:hypothetical protein
MRRGRRRNKGGGEEGERGEGVRIRRSRVICE